MRGTTQRAPRSEPAPLGGLGGFDRLSAQAERFEIEGRKCSLIALEDLIAAKDALGREKDLLAAKELRAIAAAREQRRRDG